ncbi:MAG: peptide chain release factor 2 [Thermodesulfovibrionales bacterium]|nr:peptide chain release factor 2 [Thermodesulfovibrionales bacterium]
MFDYEGKKQEILKIEEDLSKEEIWSDQEKVKQLLKKKAEIEEIISSIDSVSKKIDYLTESIFILEEEEGEFLLSEFKREIELLRKTIDYIEVRLILTEEIDKKNAIVTIHPGAGGTESQDWAQMLLRMYLRWADRKGYKTEMMDLQAGDEAGIKDATFSIIGDYAYGYMKAEVGVHRLVRISPFDANKRRHTSFAAVLVYPEIDDDIAVKINEDDLKVETFRASGAGGQHVNKVSSAVRITHIPTGIVVSSQSERSQLRNKITAMRILKAKLYDLQLREKERKLESLVGNKKDISWGNQIRSYILQPYRLVKDHRTGMEVGNVEAVLDGDIDIFINVYLRLIRKS